MIVNDPNESGSNGGERGTRGIRPLTPTVVLLLFVGALLLAIGLWTSGNDRTPPAPAPTVQPLAIVEPADSANVAAPLEVTFSTAAPLHITPMGWQAAGLHLHALVDGTEVMPGALDVRSLGDGRYRWRFKQIEPGTHTVRLVWARADHRSIPEGASNEIEVEVR